MSKATAKEISGILEDQISFERDEPVKERLSGAVSAPKKAPGQRHG